MKNRTVLFLSSKWIAFFLITMVFILCFAGVAGRNASQKEDIAAAFSDRRKEFLDELKQVKRLPHPHFLEKYEAFRSAAEKMEVPHQLDKVDGPWNELEDRLDTFWSTLNTVAVAIDSSGNIIANEITFTAADEQLFVRYIERKIDGISSLGEEMVVDIHPAPNTPMKDLLLVLRCVGESGGRKYMLGGRMYWLPVQAEAGEVISFPWQVVIEIDSPIKDSRGEWDSHSGEILLYGTPYGEVGDLTNEFTEDLRVEKKAAATSGSQFIVNLLPSPDAMFGRVAQVLDVCAELGVHYVPFAVDPTQ